MNKLYAIFLCLLLMSCEKPGKTNSGKNQEQYRPQINFSPEAHWMNDYWMAGILELMPTASYKGKAI